MTATANMDLLKRQRTFSIDETREQVWLENGVLLLNSISYIIINDERNEIMGRGGMVRAATVECGFPSRNKED